MILGLKTVKEIYENTPELISWENNYTTISDNFRTYLNNIIKKRFYYNYVGFVDVNRWDFEMSAKLIEIMPFYDIQILALEELNKIGFNKLITDSIGSMGVTHTSNRGDTTTTGGTISHTDNITNYNNTTTSNTYGSTIENIRGTTQTTEQTKDSKNLSLNADTPMSAINEDLSTGSWDSQPYVSSASKTIYNNGKIENKNTGMDKQNHTGKDTTENSNISDTDVDTNTNSTTIQKLNTDVWVTNDVKNYDYMETFKKITENLKNIITCILNELRPLFSYSY